MLTKDQATAILKTGYSDDFIHINNEDIIRICNILFYVADSEISKIIYFESEELAKENFPHD